MHTRAIAREIKPLRRMKILHVIPSLSLKRGGPSVAALEMAKKLLQRGVDITLATTNDDGDKLLDVPLGEVISTDGVPCLYFPKWNAPFKPLREFSWSPMLNRWLKDRLSDYDLVHAHALFSGPSTFAMSLARRRQVPYVVSAIGQLEPWSLSQSRLKKQLFLATCERRNLIGASAIHCAADSEAKSVTTFNKTLKTAVIPLGINDLVESNSLNFDQQKQSARKDIRAAQALNAQTPIILFLARIHPKKNTEALIRAMAQIKATCSAAELPVLIVAGDGAPDYVARLKTQVQSLGLVEQIKMVGFVEGAAKRDLLLASDVYCLPSANENFGISVLEALNAGCAAVVSDGVALSDIVHAHDLGQVIEFDKLTEQLPDALMSALRHPDFNARSERARHVTLEQFSWAACAEKFERLYRQVLATSL